VEQKLGLLAFAELNPTIAQEYSNLNKTVVAMTKEALHFETHDTTAVQSY
jgi:hypothetical protein